VSDAEEKRFTIGQSSSRSASGLIIALTGDPSVALGAGRGARFESIRRKLRAGVQRSQRVSPMANPAIEHVVSASTMPTRSHEQTAKLRQLKVASALMMTGGQ
jgi:hypothetical protein